MSIGDAVIVTDTKRCVEMMNPVAEALTGWSKHDALGKSLDDVFRLVVEDSHETVQDPFRSVIREGNSLQLSNHTCLISRDSRQLPVLNAAGPIRDSSGSITGMVLTFRDQTHERHAQRALRDSNARLNFALRAASMGAWHWDILRNQRQFDSQTCQVLGIDFDRFGGREDEFFARVHPEDRATVKAALARSVEQDLPYECDYRVIWPDGTLTVRKQLEAQLLQAQKMEAIGRLAGGIAHDFNNILAATLLHIHVIMEDEKPESPVVASLRELEHGVQRGASLTRQLLLFSRRHVAQIQRLDLNQVVRSFMNMLTRLLGETVKISTVLSPNPVWLDADPGMLEQIVMNLCVNSRDAMPKGGCLTLRTKGVEVDPGNIPHNSDARPGTFACISVTDTGCGMDEGTLKKLFEPFFTTKPAGRGTGLGLATVYGIVRQHKGWIQVHSTPGKGSTFQVYLPAAEISFTESNAQISNVACKGS